MVPAASELHVHRQYHVTEAGAVWERGAASVAAVSQPGRP